MISRATTQFAGQMFAHGAKCVFTSKVTLDRNFWNSCPKDPLLMMDDATFEPDDERAVAV